MDSSSFILTSKYQVDALGIIKGTEVFQAKLDDPDDCRVLLFDTRMNFHYNIVRKGSSTYLYFDLDVGNFINNSEVVYYMVDDRCDKVKAMCRNHKLNKISNG